MLFYQCKYSLIELRVSKLKIIVDSVFRSALFFDATAYKHFHDHLGSEARILDMLLAYVNNIQALYYHPSLGTRVRIALVHLELMQRQPLELAHLDGEREQLLDGFCAYSKKLNRLGRWDMGLYVSGLDLYAVEEGKRNPTTMGLAPVGGVCWEEFACVIAEFGVRNDLGKPYPSAGMTATFVAAHEIAHKYVVRVPGKTRSLLLL